MNDVLDDSLSDRPCVADDAHQAVEDLLWFVLKALGLLAVLEVAAGVLGRNSVDVANGFYLSASFAYVAGLLLTHQESARHADDSHPYGFGNRAKLLQFVSLCVLGAASMYLLLRIMGSRGAAPGGIGLGTSLGAFVALGISILVYKKYLHVHQETDTQDLKNLDLVLKGAIAVSAIASASVVMQWLSGGRMSVTTWAALPIIVITLLLFVRGFHEAFQVITDRSAIVGAVRDIALLAQRAAGEARIVDAKTRNVGNATYVEVKAAFPPSWTIAEANAIEQDVEGVLRRKLYKTGQVIVYWQE